MPRFVRAWRKISSAVGLIETRVIRLVAPTIKLTHMWASWSHSALKLTVPPMEGELPELRPQNALTNFSLRTTSSFFTARNSNERQTESIVWINAWEYYHIYISLHVEREIFKTVFYNCLIFLSRYTECKINIISLHTDVRKRLRGV